MILQEACGIDRPPIQRDGLPLSLDGEQRSTLVSPVTFLDSRSNGYWVAAAQDLAPDDGFRTIDDWGYNRPATMKLELEGAWQLVSPAEAEVATMDSATSLGPAARPCGTRRWARG